MIKTLLFTVGVGIYFFGMIAFLGWLSAKEEERLERKAIRKNAHRADVVPLKKKPSLDEWMNGEGLIK